MVKKYFYYIGMFLISMIVINFLVTIISYFGWLEPKAISITYFTFILISLFFWSYILGTQSLKKGYLEGIKFGSCIIGIFLLFVIIFDEFSVRSLIYYAILLLTSILGSMIGINRKNV